MTERRTPLFDEHQELGAKIVSFFGWSMPLHYPEGILAEHLQTRRSGGLFDVSHMGRFFVRGPGAMRFLQGVLTHDIGLVGVGRAQYNLLAQPDGGTVDDCYLYRLGEDELLLVVNAANIEKDFAHLDRLRSKDVFLEDRTEEIAMLALQGPETERVLGKVIHTLEIAGELPRPGRNSVSVMRWGGDPLIVARTGYTGEPVCFELFVPAARARSLWGAILETDTGTVLPAGLGARDTLRTEAGLCLYGKELSEQISGLAAGLHQLAIRMIDTSGDFVGRERLLEEYLSASGHRVYKFCIEGRGRAPREGDDVFLDGARIGRVTSASTLPYWIFADGKPSENSAIRRAGFVLLDRPNLRVGIRRGSDWRRGDRIEIRRGDLVIDQAELLAELGRPSEDMRYFVPIPEEEPIPPPERYAEIASLFVKKAASNHQWRQRECINLIASENTPSTLVRWASERDPSGRYAEHQKAGLFELFYYQGTDWIREVEERLLTELRLIFECTNAEVRPISGQMANEIVFEGVLRFFTWKNRKRDLRLRRLQRVFNHSLALGGHLSSQGGGALFNYVEVDAHGRPQLTPFPVRKDYPYAIDLKALEPLIFDQKPELLIFGKSMIIEPEPIRAVREMIDTLPREERPIILYDMAHVLGLYGPHFQRPFEEGADFVTGSTHKTFFGPQRGVVLTSIDETMWRPRFLWDFVRNAAFPGAVSNHHLGTLQGLLAAAYEFRAFGEAYQRAIHENARSFARALADAGLNVQGDGTRGYTQTHQVLLDVGTGKGREVARRLEENNILTSFQGLPGDESFRIARGLRLGVQEMTRFGMEADDFATLAQLIADAIAGRNVKSEVRQLRARFLEMRFCFDLELGD